MKICIDAGHGINTPGKRTPKFEDGNFMKEFEFNSRVAEYVKEELLKYENIDIVFSHDHPSGKVDVPLKDRTNRANKVRADLFLSIHADAYGDGNNFNSAKGTSSFVYTSAPKKTIDIAEAIHKELIKAMGRTDRGVRKANFHVLRETTMPAILIEFAFMTNREEAKLLISNSFRKQCGEVTAKAIARYFKLRKKDSSLYKVQLGAFSRKENAERLANELKEKGYETFIKNE